MNIFAAALAASGSIQDSVYGETFLVQPWSKAADPNGRGGPDPARAATTITGVWTDGHVVEYPDSRSGHRSSEGGGFSDDKPTVDFETTALPYRIAIGDRVTRMATGNRYEVSDPDDDGISRTSVSLTAFKGS